MNRKIILLHEKTFPKLVLAITADWPAFISSMNIYLSEKNVSNYGDWYEVSDPIPSYP